MTSFILKIFERLVIIIKFDCLFNMVYLSSLDNVNSLFFTNVNETGTMYQYSMFFTNVNETGTMYQYSLFFY